MYAGDTNTSVFFALGTSSGFVSAFFTVTVVFAVRYLPFLFIYIIKKKKIKKKKNRKKRKKFKKVVKKKKIKL